MLGKKIKFLFVIGSHRKGGNSSKIIDVINNHPRSKEIECNFVFLMDKKIELCKSCYECSDNLSQQCMLDDDVEEVFLEMLDNDVIVYVPVIYAFSSNSLFQAFLERVGFGFLRPNNRPLRDKLATIIVVGRRYAHSMVASQLIMNILLNEMVLVGSGFIPLLEGRSFPGNVLEDSEGIEALNKSISRLIDYYKKGNINAEYDDGGSIIEYETNALINDAQAV